MFKLLIILLFSAVSVLISQNNFNNKGERHGSWIGYHENGNMKYQGNSQRMPANYYAFKMYVANFDTSRGDNFNPISLIN